MTSAVRMTPTEVRAIIAEGCGVIFASTLPVLMPTRFFSLQGEPTYRVLYPYLMP